MTDMEFTQTIDHNASVVETPIAQIVKMIILLAYSVTQSTALTLKILELASLALIKTVLNVSLIILTAKSVYKIILKTSTMFVISVI